MSEVISARLITLIASVTALDTKLLDTGTGHHKMSQSVTYYKTFSWVDIDQDG